MNKMKNEPAMRSDTFKMGAGAFAREMIFRFGAIWLLLLSATAVAGIALGVTVDLRWLVVALLAIFILFPMLLMFLYYFYGLKRECYVNLIPHSLSLSPEGIEATLQLDEEKTRTESFPIDCLGNFKVGHDSVIIRLKSPCKGFIWIPASAFGGAENLGEALRLLYSANPNQESPKIKPR